MTMGVSRLKIACSGQQSAIRLGELVLIANALANRAEADYSQPALSNLMRALFASKRPVSATEEPPPAFFIECDLSTHRAGGAISARSGLG
jgi:hypothetical protein